MVPTIGPRIHSARRVGAVSAASSSHTRPRTNDASPRRPQPPFAPLGLGHDPALFTPLDIVCILSPPLLSHWGSCGDGILRGLGCGHGPAFFAPAGIVCIHRTLRGQHRRGDALCERRDERDDVAVAHHVPGIGDGVEGDVVERCSSLWVPGDEMIAVDRDLVLPFRQHVLPDAGD